jgi:hypothetical protein
MTDDNAAPRAPVKDWLWSRTGLVTLGAVAIFAFLIATGHRAHVFGALPYLLLLACPLMHVFMQGGHGAHDHHKSDRAPPNNPQTKVTG